MPVVWTKPDGSIGVEHIIDSYLESRRLPGESTEDAVLRISAELAAKKPSLAGATATLVKTADVPTDRTDRHKWRLNGKRVAADPSVPDKVNPKQALRDEIAAAKDVDELKAVLQKLVA
jgi:hypothetical protein